LVLGLASGVVVATADGRLARYLERFVTRPGYGIGLGSAETMELAIREVGAPRILLAAAAAAHAAAALPAVTGEHYEGGHWLGTFATYYTTRAGLPAPAAP